MKSSEVGEKRDYRLRKWCIVHGGSCDTVRLKTTWNNFSFAVHLPNIPQEKKCFWESRFLHWATSAFEDSLRVCFCLWCFGYDKNQKGLMISWKGKQNYLGTYCLLRRVKIRQQRNLRKSDSFWIDFICCQSHQKPSITHSLIWCFVWRDGGRTQWAFVSFEHPLTHEERCWSDWTR